MYIARKSKFIVAFLLAVCFVLPLLAPVDADASVPSRRILRIGLTFGTAAQASANLQNYTGVGYDFGYYDAALNFTKLAETSETKVTAQVGAIGKAGTSRTITVVATGTGRILFEYDNSANTNLILGIRPKGSETWHRGYRWSGGFRFERRPETSGTLTVVNIVDLEDYVKGVIPYEMSASWHIEALKAQAICARTYVLANLNRHNSANGYDLCNSAHCQVYQGRNLATSRSDSAVAATAGKVVTHNGSLISTLYSSSHGGGSENNENVWAGSAYPYLRGVNDNYEDNYASSISNYNWTLKISQGDLTQRVRNAKGTGVSTITSLRVSEYSPTGNVVSVVATDSNGRTYTFSRRAELQALFGSSAMRSQRFTIGATQWGAATPTVYITKNNVSQPVTLSEFRAKTDTGTTTVSGKLTALDGSGGTINIDITGNVSSTGLIGNEFVIAGRGWGHSVGMSQWGARSMAEFHGKSAEDIIRHYYKGVQIVNS